MKGLDSMGRITHSYVMDDDSYSTWSAGLSGHKAVDLGGTAARTWPPCLEQRPQNNLPDIHEDSTIHNRLIASSPYFAAIASLGAIVPGHTLIIPRVFHRSIKDSIHRSAVRKDLLQFYSSVTSLLKNQYKTNLVAFEHGLSMNEIDGRNRCGTLYPHMHIVPSGIAITNNIIFRNRHVSIDTSTGIMQFYDLARRQGEYLVIEDSNGCVGLRLVDAGIESHAIRFTIQRSLGHSPCRWQDDLRFKEVCSEAMSLRKLWEQSADQYCPSTNDDKMIKRRNAMLAINRR